MIELTPQQIVTVFPGARLANIKFYWPFVQNALEENRLNSPQMVVYALATIAAETASFVPLCEMRSKYNTNHTRFDRYENRKDLGNIQPGDGARFIGRGFVQLTGRNNYRIYGERIGHDLENNPEKANEPMVAAKILALFIADRELKIKEALSAADYQKARKLVNGGTHGIERFQNAYLKLMEMMK